MENHDPRTTPAVLPKLDYTISSLRDAMSGRVADAWKQLRGSYTSENTPLRDDGER
jgi:hypothetical protein